MEKQVIVKDLLISYTEQPGSGGTLLFLHGWRSNKEAWGQVIERLKDSKIERLGMYAIDFPGFGKSQMPKQNMTVGDYAEVVAEFITKLDLHQVVVIGHSFGGRVGIKLAATHPELISKLVLVDSAGFAADTSKKSLMGMAAKIAKPFFKPKFMQPLRNKIYQSIGAEDYVATPELQQTFVNVVKEDLSGEMAKIYLPALVIWGRNDRDTPVRFGEKMYANIRNSQLVILEHAGHFSFIDQPEEFTRELHKFIA